MKESTNTQQFEVVPEGRYKFTVIGVPEKRRTSSGKSTFRIWKLAGINEKKQAFNNISILMFPWDSKDLLLALGGTLESEDSEIVEWDDEEVDGKNFTADLYYEKDKNGKDMAKLKNISDIPF